MIKADPFHQSTLKGNFKFEEKKYIQIQRFLAAPENEFVVEVILRPRRFSKSLNLSMLKSFFRLGTDPKLFEGLYIFERELKKRRVEKKKTFMEEYWESYANHKWISWKPMSLAWWTTFLFVSGSFLLLVGSCLRFIGHDEARPISVSVTYAVGGFLFLVASYFLMLEISNSDPMVFLRS
ncbi:hypothetical protein ROZALSC1DRAFT_24197 [Rozella allomycis CSF55]|uniref:AAA-ATPase-like domain-containing protein n=1 Tax=Rozella allomycis (strain CSF55) TaxID=988480 RepID=A0A4P9YDE9_ROZAC|nr:hypothetical protein ROZALSC1DRAFT_24197 [Rozella allomycis CSF55]